MDRAKALKVAIYAAKKAGKLLLGEMGKKHSQRKDPLYLKKGYRQIKSDIDVATDSLIKITLAKAFPHYNILTEESSKLGLRSRYTWVIDPLCGTIAYLRGIPNFGTSIALLDGKEIILGVIHDPSFNQTYYAIKGKGSFCNNQPIAVSSESDVGDSIVEIQHAVLRCENHERSFVRLAQKARRIRMSDSMGIGMAYVAAGKVDAILNLIQPLYDFAAGFLLIEEAGGKISDFSGKKIRFELDTVRRNDILATNNMVHQQILTLLNV